MQSRRQSLVEVLTNTSVGLVGSWVITYSITKFLDTDPAVTATIIVILCTLWSLVRGYSIRRYFNKG